MSGVNTNPPRPPVAYSEWLDCLEKLQTSPALEPELCERMAQGVFTGTDAINAALQKQMAAAAGNALDKLAQRLIRDVNEDLACRDWAGVELRFLRFQTQLQLLFYFRQLDFLPPGFRRELQGSILEQAALLWDRMTAFLKSEYERTLDRDLEDLLFFLQRARKFESHW